MGMGSNRPAVGRMLGGVGGEVSRSGAKLHVISPAASSCMGGRSAIIRAKRASRAFRASRVLDPARVADGAQQRTLGRRAITLQRDRERPRSSGVLAICSLGDSCSRCPAVSCASSTAARELGGAGIASSPRTAGRLSLSDRAV